MKHNLKFTFVALAWALLLAAAYAVTAQAQTGATANQPTAKKATPIQAAGTSQPVQGSGTPGRLTKWTGVTGSNAFIGDTNIFENKNGLVGIGTDTPTSPLTVQGIIETTLGGYKFPDGTLQTTAGIASVTHDQSLTGAGTSGSPLGIANNGVTAAKIANGTVVRSLNGLTDGVTISVDNNLKLTPNGNNLFFGVAVPFSLNGDVPESSVLTVGNSAEAHGSAIRGFGGKAKGNFSGGTGLLGFGGPASTTAQGGTGVEGVGGTAIEGIDGGDSGKDGGFGGLFFGGDSATAQGGVGAHIEGGFSLGDGKQGGTGIEVSGGPGGTGGKVGLAAKFFGDVVVTGNLSKGGGSFKIDHPLDPENKYLYHSFVESPDMMNIYNGTVTTDASGEATVTLPDWFEALNQDFRYQLTVIGQFAQAIVAEEIKGNRFVVKTNASNIKVSWQVTGIRHDAYANKHRIPVEEQKPADEQGLYLHPDAFNQPENKGVQFVHNALQVDRAHTAREQANQTPQPR